MIYMILKNLKKIYYDSNFTYTCIDIYIKSETIKDFFVKQHLGTYNSVNNSNLLKYMFFHIEIF
jgi:hypothetical protein